MAPSLKMRLPLPLQSLLDARRIVTRHGKHDLGLGGALEKVLVGDVLEQGVHLHLVQIELDIRHGAVPFNIHHGLAGRGALVELHGERIQREDAVLGRDLQVHVLERGVVHGELARSDIPVHDQLPQGLVVGLLGCRFGRFGGRRSGLTRRCLRRQIAVEVDLVELKVEGEVGFGELHRIESDSSAWNRPAPAAHRIPSRPWRRP